MVRIEYWYVFGAFALIILALHWRAILQADLQDPSHLTFCFSLLAAATGTLAKLPPVAVMIDWLLGSNTAWLIADIFFISATCSATIWLDIILRPAIKERGWHLLFQRRVGMLLVVAIWMVAAARLDAQTWAGLERGAVNVQGSLILGSARLAYLSYNAWTLAYIFLRLHSHRRIILDRDLYIRMTMAYVAFGIGVTAPAVQILGLIYSFVWPLYLDAIWPRFWIIFTVSQTITYGLILLTFLPAGYKTIIWLDKQRLLHPLRRVHYTVGQVKPELISHSNPKWITWKPDREMAVLVTEIEMIKKAFSTGKEENIIKAPAGAMMPSDIRQSLLRERAGFYQILHRQPGRILKVDGDTYALAWWYATVGGLLQ